MKPQHILLAILVSASWGFNFVAAKWAVADFTPLLVNAIRFSIVAIIFAPFLKIIRGHMILLLTTAFILGVLHFSVTFWAVKMADGVGAISIASQLTVPFSTILAIVFLKETVGWKRGVGIVLSFSGVLVIGFDPLVLTYWEGVSLMSFAALLYSISAILMRSLKDVPVVTMQAWVGLAGAVGSTILSFALEGNQLNAISEASARGWLSILYSALGATVVGHGAANYLFRKYEVSMVSPYFLVVPLFAVLAGVFALDEVVTSRIVLGGLLTIVGVLIVTLRNTAKKSAIADTANTEG
ncbi:MAG: DMT family transporter [Kordiimonas sp.]